MVVEVEMMGSQIAWCLFCRMGGIDIGVFFGCWNVPELGPEALLADSCFSMSCSATAKISSGKRL